MTSAQVIDLTPDEPQPQVQATVELRGKRFAVREQGVSLLALMKFAEIAKEQKAGTVAVDEMDQMTVILRLLRSCIDGREWDAFETYCDDVAPRAEELMQVIADAVQAAADRPTQPPSGSPDGRSSTAPSSAAGSSSPGSSDPVRMGDMRVQRRLEAEGRPDLAQVVKRAREASTRLSTR